MQRDETVSGVLAIIAYLIIICSVLLGLYATTSGGGLLYFILTLFTGISSGMLFLGMSVIVTKLDNLGELVNSRSVAQETSEEEVAQ